MTDIPTILLWSMRISTAMAAVFVISATVYAALAPRPQRAHVSRATDVPAPSVRGTRWPLHWQYFVATLVILWIQAEVRSARRIAPERVTEIKTQAFQEVAAAYEAAAQPKIETQTRRGYVYLGQCDKQQWCPKTLLYGDLPRRCDEEIPSDGHKIISWKGAVIRETLPTKVDGKTKWGAEVARVSAGHSVVLRKLIPVSIFSTGPQYYWGLVDIPTEHPPNAELPARVPGRRY